MVRGYSFCTGCAESFQNWCAASAILFDPRTLLAYDGDFSRWRHAPLLRFLKFKGSALFFLNIVLELNKSTQEGSVLVVKSHYSPVATRKGTGF